MDYAFQKRLLRYLALGVAEDELDWTTHDNRYHGGHFDPKTMTCKARRAADEDRKMVDAALLHVMTAKPVEVTMQTASSLMRELVARAPKVLVANMIRHFESTYPDGIEVPGIGKVEVNRASAKSIMAHASRKGIPISLYAVLSSLDRLLKASFMFSKTEKWKGRSYDSFGLATPVVIGNQQKVVEFTIIRHSMGKQELYNIKVIPKEIVEERGHLVAASSETTGEEIISSTTPHSLPNNSPPVNGGLEENLKPPKLTSSNLVRQYLAANGLLSQYLPKPPISTQDTGPLTLREIAAMALAEDALQRCVTINHIQNE